MAGITFSAAKDILRMVVDNGVGVTDARVMLRTNEATQELLTELIPVNGMMMADVAPDVNNFILLPKEMENAIEVVIPDTSPGTVFNSSDVRQGWYDIINQFTYVDPSAAHDNPLVDQGLVPDPNDNTGATLRRQYWYRGLSGATTVRVTGAKRYLPITGDTDYLIIQNVPALKLMIQAIEHRENLDVQGSAAYKQMAVEMLTAEVKKHQLDPRNTMRRKAAWENDLTQFAVGTMGWIRARLALEVPGAMAMGKEELTRILERCEMRLMELGIWKGMIIEYEATVFGGVVYFPITVESVLGISLDGVSVPLRSTFFRYLENGPGQWDNTCQGFVRDLGEESVGGLRRRKYEILGNCTTGQCLKAVCLLRWTQHQPADRMIITNLEAHRLMCTGILYEQQEKWQEAAVAKQEAQKVLDDELKQYLSGIRHTVPFTSDGTFGFPDLGDPL